MVGRRTIGGSPKLPHRVSGAIWYGTEEEVLLNTKKDVNDGLQQTVITPNPRNSVLYARYLVKLIGP